MDGWMDYGHGGWWMDGCVGGIEHGRWGFLMPLVGNR